MRFITTWFHGILDYVMGLALIFAGQIFGFANIGGAAVQVPLVLGILLIIYSLLTRYELGVFKLIPMNVHLVIDFIAGLFLAISPWVFGFANQASTVWMPHLIVGIVEMLVVLFTQTEPSREFARTRAHA